MNTTNYILTLIATITLSTGGLSHTQDAEPNGPSQNPTADGPNEEESLLGLLVPNITNLLEKLSEEGSQRGGACRVNCGPSDRNDP
ncbi:MAG: hypothetical protein HRU19_18630 [Pseudobacteriovorax sp.]|nr:hypothetical protein [Pseudobacteriovorax sp.]